jgi:SpoVK/Ycf46/Vps4 family AAA+-type ATPase
MDSIQQSSKKQRRIIQSIQDLLDILNDTNHNLPRANYDRLVKIKEPLERLNQLIGMNEVKKNIVGQILYFLQDLAVKNNDMLHTCIMGSPGTGKTELAKIIADIYQNLGRSDLVGKYLGETAIKTQKVLDDCSGGVLFIDEAYSLGNPEGRDSYSKECIDTITAHLTENKADFVCIIAGYKDALEKCFFNMNQGLERRFPWKYHINEYNGEELLKIFKLQVFNENWGFEKEDSITAKFFEDNKKLFTAYGGDTETFFYKCKIEHCKRIFQLPRKYRKLLNLEDIENALQMFKEHKGFKEEPEDLPPMGMYM